MRPIIILLKLSVLDTSTVDYVDPRSNFFVILYQSLYKSDFYL